MKATIYHNARCGTSRKTLAILQERGVEVTVIDYLRDPPTRAELDRLLARGRMRAVDLLRAREPLAVELGLTAASGEGAIRAAMTAHPILINRPLVETATGVALCRPQEEVLKLL